MTESTTETELLEADDPLKYYHPDNDGNVWPVDPISDKLLVPGVIPESLLEDERLKRGFDYIQQNAGRIKFGLLLSRHEESSDMAAAGIDLEAEAKEVADNNGILFLEGTHTVEALDKAALWLNRVSALPEAAVEPTRQQIRSINGVGGFVAEQSAQIAGTGAEIALPDYVTDSERPADIALHNWQRLMDRTLNGGNPTFERMDEWYSLDVGFTVYRDWYLIGAMGSYLADRDNEAMDDQEEVIHCKLLVGASHTNIGKQLQDFGADVEFSGNSEERLAPNLRRLVQCAGNVALSMRDRIDFQRDLIVAQN